jgi:MFS family permease
MTPPSAHRASAWPLIIAAAAILAITMGSRQSMGLFIAPLIDATGVSLVSISFALAVAQFVWGVAQPLCGMLADVFGPVRVLIGGCLLLALGLAATPFAHGEWGLLVTLGVISAAGSGAASFSILIGAVSQRLQSAQRSVAAGVINAGGSFGQFVFAPLSQFIIAGAGWVTALLVLSGAALAAIPIAALFRQGAATPPPAGIAGAAGAGQAATLSDGIATAFRDPSYIYLHLGFFTCGFHIAFLVTHLPGEVALCGLPPMVASTSLALIGLFNIAGSLTAGALGQRFRMKYLLFWIYAGRAAVIGLYLLAPKTAWTMYITAAALGFSWLATVPPTSGLVGKLFGTRYLATLFGMTLLSHQIGGFLGAWLGGLVFARDGNFDTMFYADIVLALAAAFINLPIREPRVLPAAAA